MEQEDRMSKISDERREVAARMRSGIVARNIQEAYVAIVQSIGVRPCLLLHDGESGDRFDRSAYEAALTRLADLIDPTCQVSSMETYCDELGQLDGWKFHLTCGHSVHHEEPSYCPDCGARVVDE